MIWPNQSEVTGLEDTILYWRILYHTGGYYSGDRTTISYGCGAISSSQDNPIGRGSQALGESSLDWMVFLLDTTWCKLVSSMVFDRLVSSIQILI